MTFLGKPSEGMWNHQSPHSPLGTCPWLRTVNAISSQSGVVHGYTLGSDILRLRSKCITEKVQKQEVCKQGRDEEE